MGKILWRDTPEGQAWKKKYNQDYSKRPDGKRSLSLRRIRYRQTPKGKAAIARYNNKARAYQQQWRTTTKGKKSQAITHKKYGQTLAGKYSNYRGTAKVRGLEFSLSLEQFSRLWEKDCSYCGTPIATIGIDRVNNNIGYTARNVVPCCPDCNLAKRALTKKEFLALCMRIVKHQTKEGVWKA